MCLLLCADSIHGLKTWQDPEMNTNDIVVLCVGGREFHTTLQTLTSAPDSVLYHMFNGEWTPQKDEQGRIFIDRNGKLFEYILDYLRDGPEVALPDDNHKLMRLEKEADYYCLPGLIDLIDRKIKHCASVAKTLENIEIHLDKLCSCVRQKFIEDPTMSEQRRNINTICVCTHEAGFYSSLGYAGHAK